MQTLRLYAYIDEIARTGSIRQAAERLSITPSALNRRVIALEQELGVEVFERLGRGVRLSTAGELLIDMMRKHLADTETLKSRIADLSGLRRGHVSVACSQAVLPNFMPAEISKYQSQYPMVTFSILNKEGKEAAEALLNYSVDLAIVLDHLPHSEFQTALAVPQPIYAVFRKSHPLASRSKVTFSDCLEYPLALPTAQYGVRKTLETLADHKTTRLQPTIEADSYVLLQKYVECTDAIGFELKIGAPMASNSALISRPLQFTRTMPGHLHIVHLKSRTLPVAVARFAQQISETLSHE
ncbi:MAG: LysR family transcriptional regulator [Pseudomonadota bacterium]